MIDGWEKEKGSMFVYFCISFLNLDSWQSSDYNASHLCCLNHSSTHLSFQAAAMSHIPSCHLTDSAHSSASFFAFLESANPLPQI